MKTGDRVRRPEPDIRHIHGTVMHQEGGNDRWLVRWDQKQHGDSLYEVAGGISEEPHFCIERGAWMEVISPLELLAMEAET
jgi:hypothetical protein